MWEWERSYTLHALKSSHEFVRTWQICCQIVVVDKQPVNVQILLDFSHTFACVCVHRSWLCFSIQSIQSSSFFFLWHIVHNKIRSMLLANMKKEKNCSPHSPWFLWYSSNSKDKIPPASFAARKSESSHKHVHIFAVVLIIFPLQPDQIYAHRDMRQYKIHCRNFQNLTKLLISCFHVAFKVKII